MQGSRYESWANEGSNLPAGYNDDGSFIGIKNDIIYTSFEPYRDNITYTKTAKEKLKAMEETLKKQKLNLNK